MITPPMTAPLDSGIRLTPVQWLICAIAAIGFAFDIYEILMLPLIVRPALLELTGAAPGSPQFQMWVGQALLHPGIRGRHLRPHRRLPHRPARAPARADLQHPDLRRRGVPVGLLDLDRDAARAALLRVHRRVRRVRRGGRVARRALPRAEAARESARLHAGVFVARRHHGRDGQRAVRGLRGEPARADHVRDPTSPIRTRRGATR